MELLTETSVMSLDAEARTAKLQTKEEVEFGGALIATGARVNILHHLDGARLEGIHYLRVLPNSDAIRREAAEADHVVLIGGSYIASEVAASLTAKGTRCTMVMLEDVAMSRAFGEEVGRYFHEVLTSHGVELVTGDELEAFLGDGRVRAIRTKSGREIEGDVVVVGAGVQPETMLAERGGLEVDNGIVCDSKLQTSVDGIFAAGDACSYDSVVHGRRIRVEHWDVALQPAPLGKHPLRMHSGPHHHDVALDLSAATGADRPSPPRPPGTPRAHRRSTSSTPWEVEQLLELPPPPPRRPATAPRPRSSPSRTASPSTSTRPPPRSRCSCRR